MADIVGVRDLSLLRDVTQNGLPNHCTCTKFLLCHFSVPMGSAKCLVMTKKF